MHFIGTTKELGSRLITKTAGIFRGVYPELSERAQNDMEQGFFSNLPAPYLAPGFPTPGT